jgi:SPP1 gp7 family putative phage head morphogenesis protein
MKDQMTAETARKIVEDASANRVRLGKEPLKGIADHASRLMSNFNSASEVVNQTKERARILSNYISTAGLERIGYDGIIGTNEIVAFRPSQIKSATENRGTFSPDDADIRMAFGITAGLCLDRFSEVMEAIRATGLGPDLTRVQRGYARRVYQLMRDAGSKIDATTRATVANLIASNEPIGRGVQILQATLNKLGVGDHSQAQLETIYRTETARAYHSGRRQMDLRRWGDIWGFRYVTMRDDRVRPTHASWEGTVLKKGNRFWKTHYPPCGFRCRCQVVTIYKTPGYKPREVPPGKINGQVAPADEGFRDNWDASLSLSMASDYDAVSS